MRGRARAAGLPNRRPAMTRLCRAALALALLPAAALAQPVDPDLVGHWSLERQLAPASGYTMHAMRFSVRPAGRCAVVAFLQEGPRLEVIRDDGACTARAGQITEAEGGGRLEYAVEDDSLDLTQGGVRLLLARAEPYAPDSLLLGTWTSPDGPWTFRPGGTGIARWEGARRAFEYLALEGYFALRFEGEGAFSVRGRYEIKDGDLSLAEAGAPAPLMLRRLSP